jgi:two-component system, NarL family, nitrate/nitrite response regulator NarL
MQLLLCDRHRLFAESLAHVFETRGELVSLVGSPEEAVDVVAREPIDACLMELDFGCDRVVSAIRGIHHLRPTARVVILSAIDDPRLLGAVLAVGVSGILSKDQGLDHIFHTLPRLVAGLAHSSLPAQQSTYSSAARLRSTSLTRPGIADLTPREREVLHRLVMGEGTATLARRLGVTYSTARTHIQNVLSKLGVHSRLEAVAAVYYSLDPVLTEPASTPPLQPQPREQTAGMLDERMG